MVREFVLLSAVVIVGLAAMPAKVALAKDADCWKNKILACTRIIKTKRLYGKRISQSNLAITYYNRGL